jgi:hypothetical protein
MRLALIVAGFASALLFSQPSNAKCSVDYNRESGKWSSNCPYPVFIHFRASGPNCGYGNPGTGGAGPIPAGGSGDYNPLLRHCDLNWTFQSYP